MSGLSLVRSAGTTVQPVSASHPGDGGSRWERAAQDRRENGGLGLPTGFTVPRWLPIVAFTFLLANAVKQAVQADSTFDLVWAVVGTVLWGSLLVVLLRRGQPKV